MTKEKNMPTLACAPEDFFADGPGASASFGASAAGDGGELIGESLAGPSDGVAAESLEGEGAFADLGDGAFFGAPAGAAEGGCVVWLEELELALTPSIP